ncbi:tail fiber domain-containing protein [Nisaea sediminum]|uniref:tail fiber domain-containing protein n=1 Tax=Nisaea sediminum TaxID=2775867 RepID=UPI001867618D|nr:tail fiber domain-containing protein [Nisaea sediminum]
MTNMTIVAEATDDQTIIDMKPNGLGGAALRLFHGGDTQRWEFRNINKVWDLLYVDDTGQLFQVLVSNGNGSLIFPEAPQIPNATDMVIDGNGNIGKQSSSARYKENIKPLSEDFAKVMALKPVSFSYKGTSAEQIGYLAEDVDAAGLSNLVQCDNEGQPDAVNYKHLGIYAIELLKQQSQVIEQLQEKLQALETKLVN